MHFSSITFKYLALLALLELARGQGDLFKINKLNLIWNKAQHSLGLTKLKDLKNELLRHEADELNLKKLKVHKQDKDGLIEASVRKKLLAIMSRYSLDRYFDDVSLARGSSEDATNRELTDLPTFRDSKLDKLWRKAEKAGFDQEQLMILHEEFQHQQDKLDEHYESLSMLEDEINQSAMKDMRDSNSIEDDLNMSSKKKHDKKPKSGKEKESDKKARLEANMQQSLKEKHSNIKKSIEQLSKKISSGTLDDQNPFEENRVNQLWQIAVQSNFTEGDLKSLKEELEHYETRIKKLKHFQNELERHEIGSKSSKSYSENDKEVNHIKKKVQELSQKVEKADKTIERKILREEL